MTTRRAPICVGCRNLHEPKGIGLKCNAFPDGIPEPILHNVFDHREPHKGDQGIQFRPIDTEAARYADAIFGTIEATKGGQGDG